MGKSSGTTDQKIPINHFSSLTINKMIIHYVGRREKGKNMYLTWAAKGGQRKGRGETYNLNVYNAYKCPKNKFKII